MYMYHYRQGYSKLSTGQRLWCPCTIYIYIYACIITDKGTATCQRDSDSGAHVQLPALQLRRMRSRRNSNSRGVKVFFFLPSPTPPSLFFSLFRSLPTSLSHTPLSLPSLPSLPPSFALCVYFTACRAHLGVELGAARRTFQC